MCTGPGCEEISSIESVRPRERIDEVKRKQFHCGSRVFFDSYIGGVTSVFIEVICPGNGYNRFLDLRVIGPRV